MRGVRTLKLFSPFIVNELVKSFGNNIIRLLSSVVFDTDLTYNSFKCLLFPK